MAGFVGRPPKPAKLHILRGNPSKKSADELTSEFEADVSLPEPPDFLGEIAKVEYMRVGNELLRYGIVSELDRGVLTQMACEWERICWSEKKIAELNSADDNNEAGLVSETQNGYKIASVYATTLRHAQDRYMSACNTLGCTPISRIKLRPEKKATPGSGSASPSSLRNFA